MSTDDADAPSTSPDDAETAAREAVDTSNYETARSAMLDLLDEDPFDREVSPNDLIAVGEDLGNALSSLRQRHSREVREQRKAARQAARESAEDDAEAADPLAGTVAREYGERAHTADTDADGPRVVERDGRPIALGENPLSPAEMARLVAMDPRNHQDVYILNQDSGGAQRGPRADRSSSPLVPKYHSHARCSSADYGPADYSMAGLHDAKKQAVPCPECVLDSVGTMKAALAAAPALTDIPKGDGTDRVAFSTSGVDTAERERHERIVASLAGNDGATVADLADRFGIPDEQVEQDLRQMLDAGAATYEQGDEGRAVWTLVGTGTRSPGGSN